MPRPFTNVYKPDGPTAEHICPCCHCKTLKGRGNYEICEVCYWEDDGQDDHDAEEVRGGPNYEWSLSAARENYRRIGACRPEDVMHVRKPREDELVDTNERGN